MHFHVYMDLQCNAGVMETVNIDEVCVYSTLSHVRQHAQTKQEEGIVSSSMGVNMDSNTSLLLLLLKTQWSRVLHNSLLFIAPSLTYTNINTPFLRLLCSCLSVWSGRSNHSLLSSLFASVLNLEEPQYHTVGLDRRKRILLKLSPVFQLFTSHLHFRGHYNGAYCLRDFSCAC